MYTELTRIFLVSQFPYAAIQNGEYTSEGRFLVHESYVAIGDCDEQWLRKIINQENNREFFRSYYSWLEEGGVQSYEYAVSEEFYNNATSMINKLPVIKSRHTIDCDGVTMHLEDHKDINLNMAIVYFDTEEEMNTFQPPAWCSEELTGMNFIKKAEVWKLVNSKTSA